MTSETQLQERNYLRDLQQLAEARGLTLYVNPPREIVPAFLGNYEPDAIAIGPDGGIIFEVKFRRNAAAEKQLAEIARRTSRQKGWEFRVIYLNPGTDETAGVPPPTREQLESIFTEMESLITTGHSAAALTVGWAILEAMSRLASAGGTPRTSRPPFSPIRPIQTLAEEGYIENDVADRLREMAGLRNAVVHGNFTVEIPPEQVVELFRQLRRIADDVMSTPSAGSA